ncbi:flagellar hook-associated protein FlgL [Rhodococcus sp. X156]|uniref:flagellar hook-associated protein FlgL n=1 Tax=Rhodococcus sp. X156 TaxID=2499145 RepID=UPI000FD83881|nr:flagellar hook-associated protein FlgL [Rhodococcus sp. X156]
MRVTEQSSARATLAGLQSTASRLQDVQARLSSGRQITKPSDSPSGTATALHLRSELRRTEQHQSSATDALGWLTTVDSTLSAVGNQVQQVRTLVLQGLNTGSADATSNEALAQQVDQARTALLSLANATHQGRPVFGGTTAGPMAFDRSGAYVGDAGTVQRTVGPNNEVTVSGSGTAAFGSPGNTVFDVLTDIAAKLRSNPAALGPELSRLDSARQAVTGQQALAGSRYQSVQSVQTATLVQTTQLKTQLSELQDIDLADTVIALTTADTAYQAALATTAKIRQISLLDYLR